MKSLGTSLVVLLTVLCAACGVVDPVEERALFVTPERLLENESRVSVQQGAWGTITFYEGDFMPVLCTPESCPARNSVTLVQRQIFIYPELSSSDVEPIGYTAFFKAIHADPVARTSSDDHGFFEVSLEPGRYTIVVLEDGKFYSNYLHTFTVTQDAVTRVDFNINYKAVY